MRKALPVRVCISLLAGSLILAFGLYQIHSLSGITEGGVLGLNLLLEYWFSISPSITNFVASAACYLLGWKLLGRTFILRSAVAALGFSVFYRIFEQFPPFWPQLADFPLPAALLGALFVGVGTGLCVRAGAAACGDDALAMSVAHITPLRVEHVYLITDALVLGLSLSYIPLRRIVWSLLTVVLSGQLIGLVQRIGTKRTSDRTAAAGKDE